MGRSQADFCQQMALFVCAETKRNLACICCSFVSLFTPYATLRFATATKRSLVLQGLVPRSRFLQICRCYNTLHPKRDDQNIVLWLGTLRHGDFSAKTSLVLQITRKSSKSYFAAKSYFAEAAKTSFVLWLAAKTVLFLQTNLRVAYGVSPFRISHL